MDTSFDKIEVEVDEKGQKHEKTTTFINNRIRKEIFDRYLDEFCYRFNRRHFPNLCDRLTNAIALSSFAV